MQENHANTTYMWANLSYINMYIYIYIYLSIYLYIKMYIYIYIVSSDVNNPYRLYVEKSGLRSGSYSKQIGGFGL